MANIVIMPKQGLQMTSGTITKWLISEGEKIKEGDALFEMETDKLSITIDSNYTGTLLKIIRHEGEEVPITEPIAVIGEEGEDISSLSFDTEEKKEEPKEETVQPEPEKKEPEQVKEKEPEPVRIEENVEIVPSGRTFITPRARMRCAEKGITDYSVIKGTGDNGLIVERDVLSFNVQRSAQGRSFSYVSVIVDMVAADQFVENLKKEEQNYALTMLVERAVKAAQKKTGLFGDLQIRDLLDTSVCEFVPALEDVTLLAVAGLFNKEGRLTSKITIVYDPQKTEDHAAADFLGYVAKMVENPLLMLAF